MDNQGKSPAQGIQAQGRRKTHLGRGGRTLRATVYRTGGHVRTDEGCDELQALPPLGKRLVINELCLLRHCIQHQENGKKKAKHAKK